MNCGTHLCQSRNITATVVFTMNTTVFAEEAAEVDSVGVKEEVELADVDAVGTTLASNTNEEEIPKKLQSEANAFTPYKAEQLENHEGIGGKFEVTTTADGEVTLKHVTNPVSWCNVVEKYNNGKSSETDAVDAEDYTKSIVAHYEAGSLIETILTGGTEKDEYVLNAGKLKVSSNNGVKDGWRTYDVKKLDDSHFLFVGYGNIDDNGYGSNQAFASDALSKFTPVFEYDGRKVGYAKNNKYTSAKGVANRLKVDVALVEYKDNTVTKLPGVTVASVKVKDAKDATVSGQSIFTKTTDNMKVVYNSISDKQPTFTIKAKIDGKQADAKAQKKAITKLLKSDDCKYSFEISQRVVEIPYYDDEDEQDYDDDSWFKGTAKSSKGILSANGIGEVEKNNVWLSTPDKDEYNFDGFTISKVVVDKNKANLALNVDTWNGKKSGIASIKLKAGTDYELEAGSLASTAVSVLNFKKGGNFVYNDARNQARDLASAGYKYCFRATPSTDKKDKKKFRIGYYKNTNDGFCYSVEE